MSRRRWSRLASISAGSTRRPSCRAAWRMPSGCSATRSYDRTSERPRSGRRNEGPMPISIMKQGDVLIVCIQAAPTDQDLLDLRDELAQKVGRLHSRGVVIDVSVLDV